MYGIIPITIRRNPTISDKAKLLYAEITATLNDRMECTLTNAEFASHLSVTEATARKYLYELRDLELICVDETTSLRVITLPERLVIIEGNQREKKKSPKRRADLADQVVKLWNSKMGTRIVATNALISTVTARSKLFSDEDIVQAIKNRIDFVNKSEWHNDPKNKAHRNNIYLAIRNDEVIQKFLNSESETQEEKAGNSIKVMRFN